MAELTTKTMRGEEPETAGYEVLSFGPFRLDPVQHTLLDGDTPLRLGSRALEILIALVERAGEVVSKNELLARVWPDTIVEEGNLRAHITALRKVLGDGKSGIRYVDNFSGRGYRFVAPVVRIWERQSRAQVPASVMHPGARPSSAHLAEHLPASLTHIIGRTQVITTLTARMPERRFVTIVGPGGMGKTTVALCVADQLAGAYEHGVRFVDLGSLADPQQVANALALVLGVALLTEDPLPRILSFLKDKSMLIVLDNCEHVITTAAYLAEKVLQGAPGVHILATSRESLRAESEHVLRLLPLETPTASTPLTCTEGLAYPAIQLFVERAMASLDTFEFHDADARIVAEICRRLDGNPLAIELVAARVDLFGVRGLAECMSDGFQLLMKGRRTALPRQQTLRATLDWSYALLSPSEQKTLCRLSVFAGGFDLRSAAAVAADDRAGAAEVFEDLASLVAKSFITADVTGEQALYRLLETPRAYALEKLRSGSEFATIRERHAQMWCTSGAAEFYSRAQRGANWLAVIGRKVDDLRAALAWCLSPESEASVGAKLTLACLWFEFIQINEYDERLENALQAINAGATPENSLLNQLNAVLSDAILQSKGSVRSVISSATQPLGNSVSDRHTAFWSLWTERLIYRDYRLASNISATFQAHTNRSGSEPIRHNDRMLMVIHHFAGRQALARYHAERVLRQYGHPGISSGDRALHLCPLRALLSRILWIQGFPDQALRAAHECLTDAVSLAHPGLLCYALLCAFGVSTWAGDTMQARRLVTRLREYSTSQSLEYYQIWAACSEIALEARLGELKATTPFTLSPNPLSGSQCLDLLGITSEAMVSTCGITRTESGRGGWCAAEILRVKGERLLNGSGFDAATPAEEAFLTALHTAREQEALSFELRAAMSLARLWRGQNRNQPAHGLLTSVYGRFTEGFDTEDLVTARLLLSELAAGC
jgi:predicted ATPase/DNA-binding winged helix-turn-helix (wHTH) protein